MLDMAEGAQRRSSKRSNSMLYPYPLSSHKPKPLLVLYAPLLQAPKQQLGAAQVIEAAADGGRPRRRPFCAVSALSAAAGAVEGLLEARFEVHNAVLDSAVRCASSHSDRCKINISMFSAFLTSRCLCHCDTCCCCSSSMITCLNPEELRGAGQG